MTWPGHRLCHQLLQANPTATAVSNGTVQWWRLWNAVPTNGFEPGQVHPMTQHANR